MTTRRKIFPKNETRKINKARALAVISTAESAAISQAWSELLEAAWLVACVLFLEKCLTVVLTVIISLDTRQSTSELSKGYIWDGLF